MLKLIHFRFHSSKRGPMTKHVTLQWHLLKYKKKYFTTTYTGKTYFLWQPRNVRTLNFIWEHFGIQKFLINYALTSHLNSCPSLVFRVCNLVKEWHEHCWKHNRTTKCLHQHTSVSDEPWSDALSLDLNLMVWSVVCSWSPWYQTPVMATTSRCIWHMVQRHLPFTV